MVTYYLRDAWVPFPAGQASMVGVLALVINMVCVLIYMTVDIADKAVLKEMFKLLFLEARERSATSPTRRRS